MEVEVKRLSKRAIGGHLPKAHRKDGQNLRYPFDSSLAWLAVRYARTPSRVVWDLFETTASRLEPLYDAIFSHISASKPTWLVDKLRFTVEVNHAHDFPASPLQVRGTVKNAIVDAASHLGLSLSLDPKHPQLVFRVEANADRTLISLDLAGRSLHRRGQRTWTSEASLKETLAAQMLILARWDPRSEALLDPMTGAGTLVLEAVGSAQGRATWPPDEQPVASNFPPFAELTLDRPDLFPGELPPLTAIEVHTPTYRSLERNIKNAELATDIRLLHGDFRDMRSDQLWPGQSPPSRGLVIVNPPYGERLEQGRGYAPELEELYVDLRDWWLELDGEWRLAILGPGRLLKSILGHQAQLDKPMKNGPLSVSLLVYSK
ncbi:MAG: hypothetical protein KTR25_10500 [Myxococcales bacterium]|nr:hypothetical protein [Myxococcales bacterium]